MLIRLNLVIGIMSLEPPKTTHKASTLMREWSRWILRNNPKRGTVTESEKIQSWALHQFVYVSVLWIFFGKRSLSRSVTVPKIQSLQFYNCIHSNLEHAACVNGNLETLVIFERLFARYMISTITGSWSH